MQLEKNLSMGKQWFIRCEKKQKISCTWEILVFLFTYVPYNTNCPLLYSFTNIVPLNHMEFYFNLSVTITDFCCPDTAQRCFFSLRKIPPNFSEHTSPLTNPFSQSFWELMVSWGLYGPEEFWSDQPRVRIDFLGTEGKRKPAVYQRWILVLFPEKGRMFASPGCLNWSIRMQDMGNAFSVRKTCRQSRSETHFL